MTRSNAVPDLSKVVSVKDYRPPEGEDFASIAQAARDFLLFYNWCGEILQEYVGAHYPGIISMFLFKISPTRSDVDDWVWIIVGDLPPAYLTCDLCPDPTGALEGYIGEMQAWVEAAEHGNSVADLIPVNVPATPERAHLLRSRLRFLYHRILPELQTGTS